MFVNSDTLASLHIIQSEDHPNSHQQGPTTSTSGAKESLSVYGLFHSLASTSQGKQKLRQILLRPSQDLSIIEDRFSTISTLLRPESAPSLEKICKSLRKIKDMRTIIIHLKKGVNGASAKASTIKRGVWASILNFTFHALKIVEAVRELSHGQTLAIIQKVGAPYGERQGLTRTADYQRHTAFPSASDW